MSCYKYTLTNNGNSVFYFNYKNCPDETWQYGVELLPNQTKQIYVFNNLISSNYSFDNIVIDNNGLFPPVVTSSLSCITATPTVTPTITVTPTVTKSLTPTPTITKTATQTLTPTATPTTTVNPSATPTPTYTVTPTVTPTISVTPTVTPSSAPCYLVISGTSNCGTNYLYITGDGILNGKPYYIFTRGTTTLKIYWNIISNRWDCVDLTTGEVCSYLPYDIPYPIGDLSMWFDNPGTKIGCGCTGIGTFFYTSTSGNCAPVPTPTPTPTPSPIPEQKICVLVDISCDPCPDGCTGEYITTYNGIINGKDSWILTLGFPISYNAIIYWDSVNSWWVLENSDTNVICQTLTGDTTYPIGTFSDWTPASGSSTSDCTCLTNDVFFKLSTNTGYCTPDFCILINSEGSCGAFVYATFAGDINGRNSWISTLGGKSLLIYWNSSLLRWELINSSTLELCSYLPFDIPQPVGGVGQWVSVHIPPDTNCECLSTDTLRSTSISSCGTPPPSPSPSITPSHSITPTPTPTPGLFWAMGAKYSYDTVDWSTDGDTWSGGTNAYAFLGQGNGIAYNGTRWVAVGSAPNYPYKPIIYSNNAITWGTSINANTFFTTGYGVAWGDKWVAVGEPKTPGGNPIIYSNLGNSWTASTNGDTLFSIGRGVAYDGSSLWVAVGENFGISSGCTVIYSYDGITWNPSSNGNTLLGAGYGVAYNGSRWVAVGAPTGSSFTDRTIIYSDDGITWYNSANGTKTLFNKAYGVAWNGTMWVVVGESQVIAYSYDGITWNVTTNGNIIINYAAYGVAWNGYYWVVAGESQSTYGYTSYSSAYSYDGINWIGSSNFRRAQVGFSVASKPGPNLFPPR